VTRKHKPVHRIGGLVEASCLSCGWATSGRTWRPVKRRLAAHTGKAHKGIVL
jgi:hypothetical protein